MRKLYKVRKWLHYTGERRNEKKKNNNWWSIINANDECL